MNEFKCASNKNKKTHFSSNGSPEIILQHKMPTYLKYILLEGCSELAAVVRLIQPVWETNKS